MGLRASILNDEEVIRRLSSMFIPGTARSSSAKLLAGVPSIASEVMTETVAGALTICCSTFDALTTTASV